MVTEELLDDFKRLSSPFLAGIKSIEYQNSRDSHIAKKDSGPCAVLTILIETQKDYDKLQLDPFYNNWNDSFKYTNELKKVWDSLIKKYKTLDEYDTNIGYVFFMCEEEENKYRIVFSAKNEILKELNNVGLPMPAHLFCSSKREYSIILKNESDYMKYQNYELKDLILNVLKNNCKKLNMNYDLTYNNFKFALYHLKMKDINIYGLSRED